MRANKIVGFLAAAFLATAAHATTITVAGYDNTAGTSASVNVNGTEYTNLWAGPFLIGVDGGPATLNAFCLDFFTSIDYSTYSVIATPPSPALFETAAQMYSTYVGLMNSATGDARKLYGAALQLAIWEVVIDGFDLGSSNDLATGNFRESVLTPFGSELHNIVSSYLTAALGPVAPDTVIYQSADGNIPMQRLVTGGDVPQIPEPGTLALFGLGLVGIGLMRRR